MNPYKGLHLHAPMSTTGDLESLFTARGSLRSQLLSREDSFARKEEIPSSVLSLPPLGQDLLNSSPSTTPLVAYYPSSATLSPTRRSEHNRSHAYHQVLTSQVVSGSMGSPFREGRLQGDFFLSRRPSEQTSMGSIPEDLNDEEDEDDDDRSW